MNESTEASVGQILRGAREAQGMSVEDASMRLRLMNRQVAAMEADDFVSLGQPVFARGFVRNYARLLGVDAEALLARMGGAMAEPPSIVQMAPQLPRSWLTSPWLILLLLGMLVLVAVPVALYLWLNSDVSEPQALPTRTAQIAPAPPPVAEPATSPAPDAAPADAVDPETSAEATAPDSAATVPAASGAGSVLHLEFGAESWTEIRDARKRNLHRQLNPAGSRVDVTGQPPFEVVIGNAPQARLTYNGRPIDLKPFTDSTVARFTLEE
jgi:cytoskeleton protein RodZ